METRVLPRPKTTRLIVGCYGFVLLLLIAGLVLGLVFLSPLPLWGDLLLFLLALLVLAETYSRLLGIKIVECYQHYASEKTRRRCKCVPSCSEYAILCLKKYPLICALKKIRKRLFVTCKGFDYIIDHP